MGVVGVAWACSFYLIYIRICSHTNISSTNLYILYLKMYRTIGTSIDYYYYSRTSYDAVAFRITFCGLPMFVYLAVFP